MFKILSTCKGGPGYTYCKTEPPHPNQYSTGLYPLHRVVMENSLGRLLGRDEIVHHKDENKQNNAIENLEVMTVAEHGKHHAPTVDKVPVTCPCGKTFEVRPSYYRSKIKNNKKMLCCSRSCSGRYNHRSLSKESVQSTQSTP